MTPMQNCHRSDTLRFLSPSLVFSYRAWHYPEEGKGRGREWDLLSIVIIGLLVDTVNIITVFDKFI